MIHLDRNHHPSPLSPHSKQNLILPATHSDHHKILSWSTLSHDDQSFHQQEDYIPDSANVVSPDVAPLDTAPSRPGPVTPVDANDPILSHNSGPSSPASPADGNSTSPTRDRSSSLSPAPDTGSPQTHLEARSSPSPATAPDNKEVPVETARPEEEEEEEPRLDKLSRQSTPLSELSPPPDQEDDGEPAGGDAEGPRFTEPAKNASVGGQMVDDSPDLTDSHPPDAASPTVDLIAAPQLSSPQEAVLDSPSTSEFRSNHDSNPDKALLHPMAPVSLVQSPPNHTTPPIDSPITPSTSEAGLSSLTPAYDSKVVSILELNMELLKVCMEFQNRGMATTEPRFQQYSTRLQSNLTWIAAAADHSRQVNHRYIALPIMDPPPPLDFLPTERIQQLYVELPSIFAKEIARRQQNGIIPTAPPPIPGNAGSNPNPNLKRGRGDEAASDSAGKRRDTGENKGPSMMMPPPSSMPIANSPTHATPTQFSLPITNGNIPTGMPQRSPQLSDPLLSQPSLGPMMNAGEAQMAASSRERARQAQIRAHQQQAVRQISPPSAGGPGPGPNPSQQQISGHGGMPNNINAAAGPSNLASPAGMNPPMPSNAMFQQCYQILQTPNHPFIQYMNRAVQNFSTLPVQVQIQKMMIAQNTLQARQQENQQQNHQNQMAAQQRAVHMPGIPPSIQNNGGMPSAQFPNQGPVPASPVSHQALSQQNSQHAMFSLANAGQGSGSSMDPRAMASPQQNSVPGGINMSNLSQHQRQLLLMQQSRSGGSGGNPNMSMMMNPQQIAYQQQQQERMRQEQRLSQAQQLGSPTHANSPMPGNDVFPTLRSNSTIPGIARSTRSPSDSAPSPMTPRPIRGSSLGQEDYQRMMMQQSQGSRGMTAQSPGFTQQQQQIPSNWQNNQQQQAMQMSHGQGSPYGMSPTGGIPSPSNSQNWSQGNYPFSPSPGGVSHQQVEPMRHMSATPVSQMQSQNTTPPAEQAIPTDYELFNWAT